MYKINAGWGYDFRDNMDVALKDYYGKYATDIFTEKAKKIIEGHENRTQPLFLYLAHLAGTYLQTPLRLPEFFPIGQ